MSTKTATTRVAYAKELVERDIIEDHGHVGLYMHFQRSGIDVSLKDIQERATIEHKPSDEFPNVTECILTFERECDD